MQESNRKLKHYQELHNEFMKLIEAGDSEDEDLLLQQASRRQSKSRCDS